MKKRGGRTAYMIIGTMAVLALVGYFAYGFLTGNQESTDDAQIEADVVPISSRVSGVVMKVAVADNQTVKKGDLIAELDPTDYDIRVRQAEADYEAAEVQAEASSKGSSNNAAAAAQVAAARAALERAQAEERQTEIDLSRDRKLRADKAISPVELENAQSAADKAKAATAQAAAQLRVAEQTHSTAEVRVKYASAALDLAKAQLSYTKIFAPADGLLSKIAVREGQLVQPGQMLAQLVDSEAYVVANFKETQVGRMAPGQRADIEVDTFPGRRFEGKVDSISPATGARFSLLPPDNASGNFVKVVQRVPVKIKLVDVPKELALRAGLSADVKVLFK